MIIGVPKGDQEQRVSRGGDSLGRVGADPSRAPGAGRAGSRAGQRFLRHEYTARGAELVDSAAETWQRAEMVIKVKEPLPPELPLLREGLVLFTYLHLAADKELTEALWTAGSSAWPTRPWSCPAAASPCSRP